MANYFARKAGNINATDVWATTPSGTAGDFFPSFTNADVLHSNNFAITVNVNATVEAVRNDNANGATAGGSFTLSNGVTLTANVFAGSAGTVCVTFAGTSGNSASIVGNCNGGTNTAVAGATNASSGSLNITGNCTAGTANLTYGANNASTGTLTITGNCFSGSGAASAHGANNASTGSLIITGNCNGGPNGSGFGANNNSTGSMTITGDCTGGSVAGSVGANNNSTGTMTVVGTINASEFATGVGGTNRGQVTLLTGPFIASTTFGVNPIGNLSWRWAASLNDQTYITVPTNDLLATRNLVTPDNATNFPDEADVRSGTTYGISNALTGTCEVPPAASVAFGVPVDNTTGTATLSAADIWSYATREITGGTVDTLVNAPDVPTAEDIATEVWDTQTSALTTSGAIGTRLKNSSTVATTGAQLAAALS